MKQRVILPPVKKHVLKEYKSLLLHASALPAAVGVTVFIVGLTIGLFHFLPSLPDICQRQNKLNL